MDPFHVVRLAGDALDECRRRVQQAIHGHRGMQGRPALPPHGGRCTPARTCSPTSRATRLIATLFVDDAHVEVEATWGIYQRMIAAYRHEDRHRGRELMVKLIDSTSAPASPRPLIELTTLGRTLKKRAADVLAYFDRPGTSNGPTEAHQRTARTPARLRPRVPQPDQLHRQIAARDRRRSGRNYTPVCDEPLNRNLTRSIRATWSMESKHASISASSTQR